MLRRQVLILSRKNPSRVRLGNLDRLVLVWLYQAFPSILNAIAVVKPETVIRWHRHGFQAYWHWKSRRRGGRPKIDRELIALMRRMSDENPPWGAPRIHGELLMLRIEVAQSTVAKYMDRRGRPSSQGWKTFLRNYAAGIASIDLFVVLTISFKLLYGLVILGHLRRRLVRVSVTTNPTAEWIAGQVTEAFPWDQAPTHLIPTATARSVRRTPDEFERWASAITQSHRARRDGMDPAEFKRLHLVEPMMVSTTIENTNCGRVQMKVTRVGLDIAKQIFELHGVDQRGRAVLRKTLKRERMLEFFTQLEPCEVALEACGGAHYWQRELSKLGHTVRLVPANKVKPYVDGNKNNAHDAAAICEASSRPSMRFVEPKTVAQQDLQALHRVREVAVHHCTLLANHIRGLLLEYGITVGCGYPALQRALPELLGHAEQRLSPLLKQLLAQQWRMLKLHQSQVQTCDRRINRIARGETSCSALLKIEGIGPITATALVAAAGKGHQFKNGRHFSAYLGLVPGHSSTGNKTVMLPITRRGNRYLRTLLIHRARSALYAARNKDNPRSLWLQRLKARRGSNIAAVALANKNARIAWALLRFGEAYQPAKAHRPERSATTSPQLQRQPQSRLTLKPQGASSRVRNSAF